MNTPSDGSIDNASHSAVQYAGDPVTEILKTSRTIAVVGLSNKRYRPSYGVSEYMKSAGYKIIPINPHEAEVLGERCYATLVEVPERVDIVNIFRRSEFVPAIVEEAIRVRARAVWMQEGVIHHGACESARRAGLVAVMDSCILKKHIKRFRLPAD